MRQRQRCLAQLADRIKISSMFERMASGEARKSGKEMFWNCKDVLNLLMRWISMVISLVCVGYARSSSVCEPYGPYSMFIISIGITGCRRGKFCQFGTGPGRSNRTVKSSERSNRIQFGTVWDGSGRWMHKDCPPERLGPGLNQITTARTIYKQT